MWRRRLYASLLLAVLMTGPDALVLNTTSIRDEIVESLFADYRSHVRPGELSQNQTVVVVYISISAITSVNVRNMEYTMDMLLRQAWKDPRLAWDQNPKFSHYKKNIVSPVFKQKIWLPDLFFRNGKEGRLHKMTCENLLIRIQPNGEVLYSQKITMRLACTMQLHTFPMDTQHCGLDIGSYGYTLEQVRFIWHNHSPITLPPDLQISEFDPPKTVTSHDCSSLYQTSTGQYTCLNATFVLSRQLGYWLTSTYFPNILIMVVSWLNFWVSLEATPARVNLSLLTLLGVITQSTSIASSLPRVSYIKAIDVWTTACIAFNSGVLLEFAVATHVSRRKKVSQWQNDVRKVVRGELVRWCTACQQQHARRGPSASMAYLNGGERGDFGERTEHYMSSALVAAKAIDSSAIPDSPKRMSVRMTKSGQVSLIAEHKSPFKSPHRGFDKSLSRKTDGLEKSSIEAALFALDPTQTDALLLSIERNKTPQKPPPINEIDSYSRFLFPACFLIYNCFYWLYYLVLVKQKK